MKRILVIVFVIALACLQACDKKDDPTCTKEVSAEKIAAVDQTRLATDIATIDEYLSVNSISGVEYVPNQTNGVRYVITQLGTGEKIQCLESSVKVKTRGWLLKTGTEFQPEIEFTTRASGVIVGWQLLLPLVPVGSKLTAYIPSGYGYGSSVAANGKIPANAILIFDIELISIE
jgi:FKBP-type peptidyl-prolyl cis-trans isomerase